MSHQNRAAFQVQVIRVGDGWVVVSVDEKRLPSCLVTNSSEVSGQLSAHQAIFRIPHFCGITVENHRAGTLQKGAQLVRMLDP